MDLMLESGVVTQRIPFYVGTTGLSSGWTVHRQRGLSTAVAMTISGSDITEDSLVPGLYRLLLDEDTTIATGKTTESLFLIVRNDGVGYFKELRVVLYDNLSADSRQMNSSPIFGSGTPGDLWRGTE